MSITKEKERTMTEAIPLRRFDQSGGLRLILNRADTLKPVHANEFSSAMHACGQWLLFSDMLALTLAFLSGGCITWYVDKYVLGSGLDLAGTLAVKQFVILVGLGGIAFLWLDAHGHYRQRLPFWEAVGHILAVACIGFLLCGFVGFASQSAFSRLWLGLVWVLFAVFLFTGRALARRWLTHRGLWQIPTLLVGTGPSAEAAMHALAREPQMGLVIVEQVAPETLDQLARPHTWNRLMRACGSRHIVLALEGGEFEAHSGAIKALVRERLPCSIVPPWLGLPTGTLSPHHFLMHDVLMLHDTNRLTLPLPRFVKRSFDIIVSSLALLLLSPLFLLVSWMVRRDGGPAFFCQKRIGEGGRQFCCYKFRSMRIDAEDYLERYLKENPDAAEEWGKFQKLKQDVRITRLGHFIRRTSIDELPQLINVLKGEMSLIGPRPIMPGQEEFYGDDFMYYESVRPGITGPWQVSGRNRLTFRERVMLESSYARNWSLWMDIVILLKTVPAVLKNGQAF